MEYFYIQSKTVKLVSGLRFRYFDLNYVEEKKKKKNQQEKSLSLAISLPSSSHNIQTDSEHIPML